MEFFALYFFPLKSWQEIKISHHHNNVTENKTAYIYASCIPKVTFEEGLKTTETNLKKYMTQQTKNLNANPIHFSSLNKNNISEEKLEVAFRNQLYIAGGYHPYLEDIFHEALTIASEVKLEEPIRRIDIFLEEFQRKLIPTEKREWIDKDTFAQLAGAYVGHGRDWRTPLKIKDPSIQALIKELKKGTWKDGEERELFDSIITESAIAKLTPILKGMFENAQFVKAMELYFNELE